MPFSRSLSHSQSACPLGNFILNSLEKYIIKPKICVTEMEQYIPNIYT